MLKIRTTYKFAVRAKDKAGNWSSWKYTPTFTPRSYNEKNATVRRSTGWTFYNSDAAYGDRYAYSTTKGAWAELTVSARNLAVLAPTWASGKTIDVYIDGEHRRTVSLKSSATEHRQVVYSYYSSTKKTRTIKIVVRGASGGANAAFDGFVILG